MRPRRILAAPLLALCWLALQGLDRAIRRWGVGACYRRLRTCSPRPWREPPQPGLLATVLVRAIRIAWPRRADYCLRRSLLIWWSLRWLGLDADIHCDTGIDRGHAWVEYQGRVLGDRQALAGSGRFGRFSTLFAAPVRARS